MDEKSVRKSHGHHIPPAKGMGERALLLLGLLSLLTATNEMRHANAQHRAASDPSEGHAIETGQRETGALLVFDNQSSSTVVRVGRVNLDQIGTHGARRDRELVFSHALCIVEASGFDGEGEIGDGVVAGERMGFLDGVGAGIEALDVNLAGFGGRELIRLLIEEPLSLTYMPLDAVSSGLVAQMVNFTPASFLFSSVASFLTSLSA